ncbi:hypothetical protein WwAna1190 [Wolbachia endosymbiont of Drosophila ananassae]|nr:hypothetical protein WwAna1190 [Wolbachia endosymbiont of Drosophila ananassae]
MKDPPWVSLPFKLESFLEELGVQAEGPPVGKSDSLQCGLLKRVSKDIRK